MMRCIRRARAGSDEGSALVAAIGVAVVGIALSTLVVSQAIMVMNDAARDRVRTIEIHAAEAGLDSSLKFLEAETPCTGVMAVGESPNAVDVNVVFKYFDAGGATLTCTDGTLSGVPAKATVTSTSTADSAATGGVSPIRRIEAEVYLVPKTVPSMGAAIFAGTKLVADNSSTVSPLDPEHAAQVWVEGSTESFSCRNSLEIVGDLIVPEAPSVELTNSCTITGNVWVRNNLNVNSHPTVTGDIVVFSPTSKFGVSNNPYFGGDLSLGGDFANEWDWTHGNYTLVGTACSNGPLGLEPTCGPLPEYTPKGLAEVDYYPDDWSDFTEKTKAQWGEDVVSQLTFSNTWAKPQYLTNPCRMDNTLPNNIKLPAGNWIYDLRSCDFNSSNTRVIEFYGDVAIFAKSFTTSNQFLLKSGDGQPHNVWFIVPDGGTKANVVAECTTRTSVTPTYTPGNIQFSNQNEVAENIQLFVYTPCTANISNKSDLRGQIYGGRVNINSNFDLLYAGMGIPGVDLNGDPTTVPGGYSVEIASKREIAD